MRCSALVALSSFFVRSCTQPKSQPAAAVAHADALPSTPATPSSKAYKAGPSWAVKAKHDHMRPPVQPAMQHDKGPHTASLQTAGSLNQGFLSSLHLGSDGALGLEASQLGLDVWQVSLLLPGQLIVPQALPLDQQLQAPAPACWG